MAPPHIPIATRLESARKQRVSRLGFDTVIKGTRPGSVAQAYANSSPKASYKFPDGVLLPYRPRTHGTASLLLVQKNKYASRSICGAAA